MKRLDQLLVERGLAPSQPAAAALIMAGAVSGANKVFDKAGLSLPENAELTVKARPRFVSRGGEKLASVETALSLNLADSVVLDVGSSAGGFSDYALKNGAARVICVDVGTNQLDLRLRQDPRVSVNERTDIREFRSPELADVALVDVSFVSLTKILSSVVSHLKPQGSLVVLVKPQFEASKQLADRYKGVISAPEVRANILAEFEAWVSQDFTILVAADSGVTGARGNLERFYKLAPKH